MCRLVGALTTHKCDKYMYQISCAGPYIAVTYFHTIRLYKTYEIRIFGLLRENLILLHGNNKGADRPAHMSSPTCSFIFLSQEITIAKVA